MALKTITPPATEPISLSEAKKHLRVEITDDDALINALIVTAREYCEGFQNRKYITQTLELILDSFPLSKFIEFKDCSPIQSITSIKHKDHEGTETTWDADNYIVDADSFIGKAVLGYGKSWPSFTPYPVGAVRIQFVAGYGNASAVPSSVKQAMLLLVGHWYENREAASKNISKEMELAVHALLSLGRAVPV